MRNSIASRFVPAALRNPEEADLSSTGEMRFTAGPVLELYAIAEEDPRDQYSVQGARRLAIIGELSGEMRRKGAMAAGRPCKIEMRFSESQGEILGSLDPPFLTLPTRGRGTDGSR
jgi:hypothetical protein